MIDDDGIQIMQDEIHHRMGGGSKNVIYSFNQMCIYSVIFAMQFFIIYYP